MDRNEKARAEFEQGRQNRQRNEAIERLTGDMQLGRAGVMDRFGNMIHAGDHILIRLPNDPVMEVISVTPNLDPHVPVGMLKVIVRCEVPIMCAVNQPAQSMVRIGKADTIANIESKLQSIDTNAAPRNGVETDVQQPPPDAAGTDDDPPGGDDDDEGSDR